MIISSINQKKLSRFNRQMIPIISVYTIIIILLPVILFISKHISANEFLTFALSALTFIVFLSKIKEKFKEYRAAQGGCGLFIDKHDNLIYLSKNYLSIPISEISKVRSAGSGSPMLKYRFVEIIAKNRNINRIPDYILSDSADNVVEKLSHVIGCASR